MRARGSRTGLRLELCGLALLIEFGRGGSLQRLALGLLADPVLERAAHPLADRLRREGGDGRGLLPLLPPERQREEERADEHRDHDHPRLRHDPARKRPLGRSDELPPAAHRKLSRGTNRQLIRSSPIWSHPSPSTRRAM